MIEIDGVTFVVANICTIQSDHTREGHTLIAVVGGQRYRVNAPYPDVQALLAEYWRWHQPHA